MTLISGAKFTGMRLDGAAFMSPVDLGASVWLRRGLGISVDAGVSQWNDQSGNNRHFVQANTARQPSINEEGIVSFDGVDDFLRLGENVPNNNSGEIFIVARFLAGGVFASLPTNTTIDADAFILQLDPTGALIMSRQVTSSNLTRSLPGVVDLGKWIVVSGQSSGQGNVPFGRLFVSGQELDYAVRGRANMGGVVSRMDIGGESRATPINYIQMDMIDFAFFSGITLNDIQRSRLVAFYHNEYSDLLS